MSTEKTDNTSTTAENKTNDNNNKFGPLGKYAVVATIMVSIIMTTAIMLNKQLDNADEQLAAIETQNTAEAIAIEAAPVETQAVKAPSTEGLLATEITAKKMGSEAIISTQQVSSIDAAVIKPTMRKNSAKDNQAQLATKKRDQERLARFESYKLEHKQHMAEMFARIKSLESKQLDRYKTHQDKQVARLRQQVAKQELLIEALILRNKERIDMRAASMHRSQLNREKMISRI